jgi:hypothetical protein
MENNLLEKIDLVRERTGCNYEKAKELLLNNDNDVVEAIIEFEKENLVKEEYNVKSKNLVDKVKEIIKKGNVKRILIKEDDKVILDIPVNAGVVAIVLAPYLTILGGIVALANDYKIEVIK